MKRIYKLQYLDSETSLNQTFHPPATLFGVESRTELKLDKRRWTGSASVIFFSNLFLLKSSGCESAPARPWDDTEDHIQGV